MIEKSRVRVPAEAAGELFSQSRVRFLCWVLFRYPRFHPHVTEIARKRPQSFCQQCGWQYTDKYACTQRMWLCTKWLDIVLGCMVYTEHAEIATVLCGTSHVTTKQRCKYSTLVDIENRAIQKVTVTHFESHVTKAQKMNWRVERYIKVIIIIIIIFIFIIIILLYSIIAVIYVYISTIAVIYVALKAAYIENQNQ